MIVSHNINLIVALISCVTLLLNLVTTIWKINLKYPGSSQPTRRHSDCETTTNRQKEYRSRLPRLAEPSLGNELPRDWGAIGFRSRFSQCVDYMRFNEKSFCFRWQETTKLMLFFNTKTSSLVVLCDLRYLTGNISSVMTKHMGVQRRLHRFAYLIVQIILWFYS